MSKLEAWVWTVGILAVILAIPTRSLVMGLLALVALPVGLALLLV
jgi:hypothetical protein